MNDSTSLLQEIEEDLQRQRIEALWKRYGTWIVAGALALVLGTAAWTSWNSYRIRTEQAATGALVELLSSKDLESKAGDKTKALEALETYARDHRGADASALATLQAAGVAMGEGKVDKALALYDALAEDTKADAFFRDFALLLSVQAQVDRGDAAALQARLQPLFKESAWRFTAKETAAHLALKAGDKEKAKQLFTELAQDASPTPASILQRAKDMLRWMEEGA